MNHNDFGGAVIPAMAGFFLFGKRAKVQQIQENKPKQLPAVLNVETGGLTGVAKYLISAPLVTGVTKYLKKKDKHPMSSVEKYVLRQAICERNAPVPTGVAKYLAKAAKEAPSLKKSSVERYIAKQEFALRNTVALTGVARYEAEQNQIAKKKALAELIEKYRNAEEAAARSAREAAEIAYESSRYMNQDNTEEAIATTRVGRYLQEQAGLAKKTAKATSVSRYIAKQIILDSQKPTVSKVTKYLQEQSVALKKKPKLTGVARYLSNQHVAAAPVAAKGKCLQSGVAKYLAAQSVAESTKPVLSGVAKYMEKQAKLASDQSNVLRLTSALDSKAAIVEAEVVECLEGEFIPAREYAPLTGVARYLDKQSHTVTVSEEVAKGRVTGVSRYLEQKIGSVKQSPALVATGVDRYLLKRA